MIVILLLLVMQVFGTVMWGNCFDTFDSVSLIKPSKLCFFCPIYIYKFCLVAVNCFLWSVLHAEFSILMLGSVAVRDNTDETNGHFVMDKTQISSR